MSLSPICYEQSPDFNSDGIRRNLFSQSDDTPECLPMHIYARVRPMLAEEVKKGFKECIAAIDETTVRVVVPETSARYKASRQKDTLIEDYTFTAAFGPETGQFVFFQEAMLNSMENFVEGNNSLIFSYGITGSGKTYTLLGNSENPGIIPLSLKLYFAALEKSIIKDILFKPTMYNEAIKVPAGDVSKEYLLKERLLAEYDEGCESAPGCFRNNNSKSFAMTLCNLFSDDFEMEEQKTTLGPEDMASAQAATLLKETIKRSAENLHGVCNVWVSFIEIYNENIYDLLQPVTNSRSRLTLGEDKNGNVFVKGAREICVFNSDEALKLLNIGRKNLSIASTKLNYTSSRSHCIYSIRVVRVPDKENVNFCYVSRMSFCDLAGSERTSKAQTSGVRLKEAGCINTSLLVLGRCIEQLRFNQTGREKRMIPFRESKLTRLFSSFFMGYGRAVMIANASPSDYTFDETLHVLKFSAVAKSLMMSTFFSETSSTIQSVYSQWEKSKANTSVFNESMESVDSNSDVIQMKDELIEKLLGLLEGYAKKEKEMADMEMRIRQEVCNEYREYSDELLEERRIRHEEEKISIREMYEKHIKKTREMYDKALKGYYEQFNTTEVDESLLSEQSEDLSKSFQDLDKSSMSDCLESELVKSKDECRKSIDQMRRESGLKFANIIEDLQKQLLSAKDEIAVFKDLIKSKELNINELEAELNESKLEYGKLAEKCAAYKKELSKSHTVASDYKTNIEELKKMLSSTEKKISVSDKLIQSNELNIQELNRELCISNAESKKLAQQCADYEEKLSKANETVSVCQDDIEELKIQLSTVEKNLSSSQESVLEREQKMRELETDKKCLESSIETLRKEMQELKDLKSKIEKELECSKAKSATLEDQLNLSKQDYTTGKEHLQHSLEVELKKEKEKFTKEIKKLEDKISELRNEKASYEVKICNYKENITALESKLSTAHEELKVSQERELQSSNLNQLVKKQADTLYELSKEIEKYKGEIAELKRSSTEFDSYHSTSQTDIQKLKSKISMLENDLEAANKNVSVIQKEKQLKEIVLKQLEKEIDSYRQDIESLQSINKNLANEKKELEEKLSTDAKDSQQSSMQNQELEKRELKIAELEKSLASTNEELENLKEEYKQKSEEQECLSLNYKQEVEKMKQEYLIVETEKRELSAKLSVAHEKVESLQVDIPLKSSKIDELLQMSHNHKEEIDKLKKDHSNFEVKKKELEAKLDLANEEIEALQADIHLKSSKMVELQELSHNYKQKLEKMKQEYLIVETEKKELSSKLSVANEKVESLQVDIQSKSSKIDELLQKINFYTSEREKNKKDYESLQLKVAKENENRLSQEKKENYAVEKLQKLNEMIEDYKKNIQNLNETLKLTEKEKQDLLILNADKEKKIEDLENELLAVSDKLTNAESDITEKIAIIENMNKNVSLLKRELEESKNKLDAHIKSLTKVTSECNVHKIKCDELKESLTALQKEKEGFEKELASEKAALEPFKELLNVLEKCEGRSKSRIKDPNAAKQKIHDLIQQIRNKEASIQELEKALNDAQEQLKEVQAKCDQKVISVKEQHEVEIQQIMNVKQELEEENQKLKKNSKLVEGTVPKKERENLPKRTSSRTLQRKQTKQKDQSFSSVEDLNAEPGISIRRNRKRLSDEDFEPAKERALKKKKAVGPTKIPLKKPVRRKIEEEKASENLSPVQKMANAVSSTFRNIAENVSKVTSPRLTRGRKKLFNPDLPSSDKGSRGKKM